MASGIRSRRTSQAPAPKVSALSDFDSSETEAEDVLAASQSLTPPSAAAGDAALGFTKRKAPNPLISRFWDFITFPSQLLFALAGMIGMAHYARQIVKIAPTNPARIRLARRSDETEESQPEAEARVDQWIADNVKSLKDVFRPSWWAPNGHLQTFYTVTGDFTKVDKVHYVRTYLRLPDGGTIGIDVTPEDHQRFSPETPTIVVCHGLTGGSHESYVRNILAWVIKPKSEGGMGARGAVVNFRGCAGVPVTSPQMYSAGTTMDLASALHFLRYRYPSSPFHGIGFSLGASVLSRYLGETGSSSLLSSGIVLGCPWDLAAMSHKLEHDFFTSRVYSSALGKNVLNLFFKAYDANPAIFEADDSLVKEHLPDLKQQRASMGMSSRLRQVDEVMVCKIGGPRGIGAWPFKGAEEYYKWASPRNLLGGVKVPLLAINAFDDPVVDCTHLPLEEIKASSHIYAAVTGSGGHLGWFDGPFPLFSSTKSKRRWVLKPVSEFLLAAERDLDVAGAVKTVEDEGWALVEEGGHKIPSLDRVAWKVLSEGEVVSGEGDEGEGGVIQGL
ncbi:anon-23da protein [Kwoniella heveanensis BCC8398]|uniref:Anon-23da protein n=1 Tax=Kwoniella heveanensis BCC8398 TaxID=1296120 RepID=A0A1B9GZA9_9TREE|nr:anon-23da protein [Kwoniella heveanensis BCC8398]